MSGIDFAPKRTLVDAMIGRPHVVTMGVREQVVKPATKIAGKFAMSRVTHLPRKIPRDEAWRRPIGAINAVTWVIGLLMLGCIPVHAGSATAQFGVSAQVVKSCKVSTDALASQAASANGTINISCQSGITPQSPSAKADGAGSAFPSGTANVNYTVLEVAGSAGGLKIVTVDF